MQHALSRIGGQDARVSHSDEFFPCHCNDGFGIVLVVIKCNARVFDYLFANMYSRASKSIVQA